MRGFTTAAAVVAAAVSLAACSGGGGSSTPGVGSLATSTTVTSSAVSGRTVSITVAGSTVTPAPTQVDLPTGQTLTVVVTSDHDDVLHAHGFGIEQQIKAGVPATIALTGNDPGVYEVELHHPALMLLTVAVR